MQRGLGFKGKRYSTGTQTHSFFQHSHCGKAEHPRLAAAPPWHPSTLNFVWFSELSLPCCHFWGVICLISPHHPRSRVGAPRQPGWCRCWFLFYRGDRACPHPPTHALSLGLLWPAWQVTTPKSAVTLSSHSGCPMSPHTGCSICGICVLLEGWI